MSFDEMVRIWRQQHENMGQPCLTSTFQAEEIIAAGSSGSSEDKRGFNLLLDRCS